MSHQTGIQANDELQKYFAKCRDGLIGLLKISIDKEQLVLSDSIECVRNKWEQDYDSLLTSLVEENIPCYILYRLETKNTTGYDWLLINWCPDTSMVRHKMLYASTKSTLKQQFGSSLIADELHGTILSDILLSGYAKHKKSKVASAPLTSREEELEEIKKTVIHTDVNVDSRHQTLGGVQLPISESAKQAITDMARGSYEYLQFKIDLDEEKIHLVTAENISLDKLSKIIPIENARYHLYKFKHTHEGDYMEDIVFIYSMPGYNCSIKERMLYSSCKGAFTDSINSWGLELVKKVEIETGAELTEKFLYEEIHPIKNLHRPKFAKPKGPPNRGPKRMTKANDS